MANVADDTGLDPQLWQAVGVMFPSAAAAMSFLLFNLLDAPCLGAISTLAKEMNSHKWTAFAIGWQMFYAYSISLVVYQLWTWFATGMFGLWTIIAIGVVTFYLFMIVKPMNKVSPKQATK